MVQEPHSQPKFIPHLFVLLTILVMEYWVFTSQAPLLISAGDYGPLVGITLIVSILVILVVVFGLYSICGNSERYEKIVSISLILFIIQIVVLFIEYVIIAIESAS